MHNSTQKSINANNLKSKSKSKPTKHDSTIENQIAHVAKTQVFGDKWYKLDNAGLIYPLNAYDTSKSMFAISATLFENVEPLVLQRAINLAVPNFPTITGAVRNGFFWPYIDKPSNPLMLTKQNGELCKEHNLYAYNSQVRITYKDATINVEFFHSATDGCGAVTFVNSLLTNYFMLLGYKFDDLTNSYPYTQQVDNALLQDKFNTIAVKNPPPLPKAIRTQKLIGDKLHNGYRTTRLSCKTEQLKKLTKQLDCTVTQLYSAIMLHALSQHQHCHKIKDKRPISILVPVDFRRIYNVQTVRNFSNYIILRYNGGHSSILDTIKDVKAQMHNTMTDDYYKAMVSYNYKCGNNIFLRIAPLCLKKLVIKTALSKLGEGAINCGTLSNIGVVKAPKAFDKLVKQYNFTLGRSHKDIIYFATITHGDTNTITVTSSFASNTVETSIVKLLQEFNIDVQRQDN